MEVSFATHCPNTKHVVGRVAELARHAPGITSMGISDVVVDHVSLSIHGEFEAGEFLSPILIIVAIKSPVAAAGMPDNFPMGPN